MLLLYYLSLLIFHCIIDSSVTFRLNGIVEGLGVMVNPFYITDLLYLRNNMKELEGIGLLEDLKFWFQANKIVKDWSEVEDYLVNTLNFTQETVDIIEHSEIHLGWVGIYHQSN